MTDEAERYEFIDLDRASGALCARIRDLTTGEVGHWLILPDAKTTDPRAFESKAGRDALRAAAALRAVHD